MLTNLNFNALAAQIIATNPMFRPGDRMLSAMPLFHGFGLGVCIHSMLANGGRCILIPRFTAKSYAKQIVKYKCNFIAGVPTLYEALLRLPSMDGANLSSLKGVFSGGDSLSIELKKKFDKFLYDHNATVQVREGYGTTETVTACCLTPTHMFKEGSIGLPFPDTYIKIVEPGTDREVPYGTEGEILLAGPTVMKEYMKHPEETAQTLRTHADGLTWVYTGDLGVMDEQGFIYFRGRAKRMIISSGYNVYPGQIENVLDAHDAVQMSCVIGVPDAYKMQKVKAFVKLRTTQRRRRRRSRTFSTTAPGMLPSTPCRMTLSSGTICPRRSWARSPTACSRRKSLPSSRRRKTKTRNKRTKKNFGSFRSSFFRRDRCRGFDVF